MIEDTLVIKSNVFEVPKEQHDLLLKFAGQAMQSLITTIRINDGEDYNYTFLARDAFKFAEAMLETYKDYYER